MKLTEAQLIRLGNAVVAGWGLRWPKDPIHAASRGSIWICTPDKNDEWRGYKECGPDWLDKCLDEAGIP